MVSFRIKRVVNGMTIRCAQTLVVFDNRRSAAVSENKIVFGNERAKCVGCARFYTRKSSGSINVPEGNPGVFRAALQDFFFEKVVKDANTAVLYHQIARCGLL